MQQMEAAPTHHPNNLPYHSPKIFNGFAGGFGWANLQFELPDFLAEIDRWGREPVPIVIQNGTILYGLPTSRPNHRLYHHPVCEPL